ncbi:uncharacterized protein TRAVEDRAFT_72814 [Trametes versicolor FP-101664 SS1]|uniref:uncharacterized protein n=1 Tax=Trametes versicolor (strain FP-101664) TaxID=717944 RepID=UPI0004623459|nr:uncharacterized protein TRAVEDRAFT_72814 [Trametes versicolor FP-101664 SS1]EIW57866.1 hypothetical protein TRAVEDRAFT_72814 [Trametes versicolor FP-101664 SS1]
MSSTTPLVLPSPSLGPAYGSLLICTFLSLMFYGIALHQVYRYLRLHSSDAYLIKGYVALLLVLDTFHTVLAIHMTYHNLVTNFFRPYRLEDSLWSLNLQPVTTGAVIVTCQVFFARRAYIVNKKYRPLVVAASGLFLGELAFSIAFTVKGFIVGNINQLNRYAWLQSAGFGVAIGADVVITSVLVLALHRSRTGFEQTDSLIDVLIAYSICTGFLTLVFALACFITAIASSGDLLLGALDLICVKVYVNSVLATLNARPRPRSRELCELRGDAINLSHRAMQSVDKDEWTSTSQLGMSRNRDAAILSIKVQNAGAREV